MATKFITPELLGTFLTQLKAFIASNYASASDVEAIESSIVGAYVYAGSVDTYADLTAIDTTDLTAGAVYNVVNDENTGTTGMNYAWTGSAWNSLGPLSIDLSDYYTKDEVQTYVSSLSLVDATALANALLDYVTSTSLSETLASYWATADLVSASESDITSLFA